MKSTSAFRIILLAIFAVLAVIGVIAFSGYRGSSPADAIGRVEIWGTYNESIFRAYLRTATNLDDRLEDVTYRSFSVENFDQEVLEAMATGASPDLLFVPDTHLYKYLDKIYTINPESYTRSTFSNNFVDGSEIFFQNGGIVGLPLAVDPLVMFWNRDLFASAGEARPPESWTEFFDLAQKLSLVDQSLNIRQSAIAFGETENVDYFRAIIASLLLQIGNPIIKQYEGGSLGAVLTGDRNTESASAALRFYTEFSDASKSVYSWNRSMPSSEEAFLSNKLAVYFAPASQIVPLRKKNPNLNFAVAEIPTVEEELSPRKAVYAPVYGFIIPRASDNLAGAFQAAVLLTQTEPMRDFVARTNLAPVRRDLIQEPSEESYLDVIKKEALYARTFLDPHASVTTSILADMVENITSGQRSIENAIYVSNAEINELLAQ